MVTKNRDWEQMLDNRAGENRVYELIEFDVIETRKYIRS
jgi:hypothetical protein